MKKKLFYPRDGRQCVSVSSLQDIKNYMGELGNSIDEIIIDGSDLVIGYLGGQGITLGQLKEDY